VTGEALANQFNQMGILQQPVDGVEQIVLHAQAPADPVNQGSQPRGFATAFK